MASTGIDIDALTDEQCRQLAQRLLSEKPRGFASQSGFDFESAAERLEKAMRLRTLEREAIPYLERSLKHTVEDRDTEGGKKFAVLLNIARMEVATLRILFGLTVTAPMIEELMHVRV